MKKTLKTLVLLLLLGGFVYKYESVIVNYLSPYINNTIQRLGILSAPCENPISYSIGTFDTKFGISQKDFLSAIKEAEDIWEKPVGKELFSYKIGGDLKVNLIYDYRQEATNKLEGLGVAVEDNRASYEALKSRFNKLKASLAILRSEYDQSVESFNTRERAYVKEVEYWNSKGGAPKEEYNKLQAESAVLKRQSADLSIQQGKINDMVSEINALVVVLNSLASTLNISVDKYNTIGASRGESFEEGVYTSDGINQQIDIYEFSSNAKLVRVLAHELGHALGLEHIDDPKAIMYELNQGNTKTLTGADIDALKAKCQIK